MFFVVKFLSLSYISSFFLLFSFFFNDTATTEIYTLSLHDALPISRRRVPPRQDCRPGDRHARGERSEEHTSELQSLAYLVCRLLLEKKKQTIMHLLTYRAKSNTHNRPTADRIS